MINPKRHQAIFDPHVFSEPVHIIGCGGMGSHLATALVRMGVGSTSAPIALYDSDTYADHNRANQAISLDCLNQKKVSALARELARIDTDLHLTLYDYEVGRKFGYPSMFSGVVILCVDCMNARNEIVKHFLSHNPAVTCVIETRMDARTGISHCFDPNNQRHLDCWWLYWTLPNEAENAGGCNAPQSIISAIYGTCTLALEQFKLYANAGTTWGHPNRVYQEFEPNGRLVYEVWPTEY
jgi:molybdopterin/thiamine biosynthesis adenylyltransferase